MTQTASVNSYKWVQFTGITRNIATRCFKNMKQLNLNSVVFFYQQKGQAQQLGNVTNRGSNFFKIQ